jgi:hypothetical protein
MQISRAAAYGAMSYCEARHAATHDLNLKQLMHHKFQAQERAAALP